MISSKCPVPISFSPPTCSPVQMLQRMTGVFSDRFTMGNILIKATPLILTGLAFSFTYKANLYNIGSGLPLDMIFGSLATLGSAICMYLLRKVCVKGYPLTAMLMPAIWNGVIVGWEIEYFFIEGKFEPIGFLTQGGFVALGELAVMFTLGTGLFYAIKKHNIDKQLKNNRTPG